MAKVLSFIPGFIAANVLALLALYSADILTLSPMLLALAFGLLGCKVFSRPLFALGVEFTSCHVLRFGVALLGLRIAFNDLLALGLSTALLMIAAIVSTIALGTWVAKLLGMPKEFGILSGGACGICGASAAIAISSVLPEHQHKERDTVLTIVGVTMLSTLAMIVYPFATQWLGLSDQDSAIFFGGSIHDVAQVVGAGYSVSQETGDLAVLTKLIRVAFLMPVVLCILLIFKQKVACNNAQPSAGFPPFLLIFAALMILNSSVKIPSNILHIASNISQYALVVSIAAIGMKLKIKQLMKVGVKPFVLLIIETLWIGTFVLLVVVYLSQHR